MNVVDLFRQSLIFVASDQYFWFGMGLTFAISMFVGAIIYNGDMAQAKKGLVTISSYAMLLIYVNVARIGPQLTHVVNPSQPFAGIATILYLTVFYVAGMVWGVGMLKFISHK